MSGSPSPATPRRILLEVIVETVADARAAARGGADRLEIVRALDVGGLTPPVTLVRDIAAAVHLPLRVMVRGNGGYGTDAGERARLRAEATNLAAIGVDGLVVGFADEGQLLLENVIDIIPSASVVRVTFHRAFDQLIDPFAAIDSLKRIANVDRILTSGDEGSPETRCQRLRDYQERAGDRLTIIAGGGVDEAMLLEIVRTRAVREVHVGRAAREGLDPARPVSAERVAHLVEMLHRGG